MSTESRAGILRRKAGRSEKAAARLWTKHEAEKALGHSYVELLGLRIPSAAKLIRRIEKGLPFSVWERFVELTGLTGEIAAAAVRIPRRTLSRRKVEGRLQPEESDRLLRSTRLFAAAWSLFEGELDSTRHWWITPQPALGGAVPVEHAATDVGARDVEALIGRLEHGIPI